MFFLASGPSCDAAYADCFGVVNPLYLCAPADGGGGGGGCRAFARVGGLGNWLLTPE